MEACSRILLHLEVELVPAVVVESTATVAVISEVSLMYEPMIVVFAPCCENLSSD